MAKVCWACGVEKPWSEFYLQPGNGRPYRRCKKCHNADRAPKFRTPEYRRNAALKSKYGITAEEFDRMAAEQGGVCAVCKQPPKGRWNVLAVDHDHTTGAVRELLCDFCNRTYGAFEKHREQFLAYDRRHHGESD